MVKEVFVSEETVALAKQKACELLGVEEKDAGFDILQIPTPKTLGLFGGKLAQVRAYIKSRPIDKAVEILKEMLFYMGLESLTVDVTEESENVYNIKIDGDDVKAIVGFHGETLDSIQYLLGLLANEHSKGEYCTIRLEAGNYRDRRRLALEALAKKLAHTAINFNRRITLEPMRSYERKIIHNTIQTIDGVVSRSEGIDSYRHVVIFPLRDGSLPTYTNTKNHKNNNLDDNSDSTSKEDIQINSFDELSGNTDSENNTVTENSTDININSDEKAGISDSYMEQTAGTIEITED